MKTSTLLTIVRSACLVGLLLPGLASAQSDTLTMSGTFQMLSTFGDLGGDLAAVYDAGRDHTWTLTLQGVTYAQDYSHTEYGDPQVDGGYYDVYSNIAHAASYTLEFFGPHAETLNAVVSAQLDGGGLTDGGVAQLNYEEYFDALYPEYNGAYISFQLSLVPQNPEGGISFHCYGYPLGAVDPGYVPFTAREVWVDSAVIADFRAATPGYIYSFGQRIALDSDVPPYITPYISILDRSIVEGNKGTSNVGLTVRLSGAGSGPITAQYRTISGTAAARHDYTATTGTVTFQPGQTEAVISIPIKGDRKREPSETFTVALSNLSGAAYRDSSATVTIVNDD